MLQVYTKQKKYHAPFTNEIIFSKLLALTFFFFFFLVNELVLFERVIAAAKVWRVTEI